MPQQMTPILAAPFLAPECGRIELQMAAGQTIAQIVDAAFPNHPSPHDSIRVVLVSERGSTPILPAVWGQVRAKAGVRVVLRTIPGKDALGSILSIVVAIAATAFAPQLAGLIFGAGYSQAALTAVTIGLSMVGQLLVSALIPAEAPGAASSQSVKETFSISGWRNEIRPGAPLPRAFGKMRYAPPFAATSYTEIVGDEQYVRALFTFGYGPVRLSDLRIGETSVDDFDDIDIEVREGYLDDLPVTLYPRQVIEAAEGVDLVRPFERDAAGEIIADQPTVETPVVRFTASNATEASVLLGFGSGLYDLNDNGDAQPATVSIRIRARLNGEGSWQEVATLDITAANRAAFLRQHTWELASRGRWQIEVTRLSDESTSTRRSDRVQLSAIQSIRPEYPINVEKPLAVVALRGRATYQFNGAIDSFNAMIESRGPVHENDAWMEGYGRTPATAFLLALSGPSNPFPVSTDEIDMDQVADWHDWCVLKGLKYDRVHDQGEALSDMLRAICAAGRATYRHDGVKWGVVIDRPEDLVVDHISPRNSDEFTWSRSYFKAPDGFRVRFLDETNDYSEAERIVPWPGHVGDVSLTEELQLPGKTDPDEIWIEARRRQYELIHRPDTFTAVQDGSIRIATRGDLVMGSFDVLDTVMASALVKEVRGRYIVLDDEVDVGEGYAIRFRTYQDDDDIVGVSTVRDLQRSNAPSKGVLIVGEGALPSAGEVVHIGPKATESLPLRLKGVEAGNDFSNRLIMVAAAAEIDDLVDAETPPAWDGRVGAEINTSLAAPAVPVVAKIETGMVGTGVANGVQISVAPGVGSATPVTGFIIDARVVGTTTWITKSVSSAASGAYFSDFAAADEIEIRVAAFYLTTSSGYTEVINVIVGGRDPDIPTAFEEESVVVSGSLGHANLAVTFSEASSARKVQFYRTPAGVALDKSVHAIGTPVAPTNGPTVHYQDGDATRVNLLPAAISGVSANNSWTADGNTAQHVPGAAGNVFWDLGAQAGAAYRIAVFVTDYADGSIWPRFTGEGFNSVDGTVVSEGGLVLDRIIAPHGVNRFNFRANIALDAGISDPVLFKETPSCIASGSWDYYVEPLNKRDLPGPVSGPFTATIL